MKSFESFQLDTINHCLWRGEDRVTLAPKAFDVLRYLVEHSDRLVSQDEILEALWPETYVNPEVVKKYVLGIRKVLGDQTSKPTFIATFPRRGYQFIAPVRDKTVSKPSSAATKETRTIVGREAALRQLHDAFTTAMHDGGRSCSLPAKPASGRLLSWTYFFRKRSLERMCRLPADNAWKALVEKRPTTRSSTLL